jgi:hypothetical protein
MNLVDPLEPEFNENGRIVDYVNGDLLEDRSEERVRQRLERLLHIQYEYPKNRMAREIPIYYGKKEVRDAEGRPVRADVGVFRTVEAARKKDQGQVQLIAETKRPKKEEGYAQLVSYWMVCCKFIRYEKGSLLNANHDTGGQTQESVSGLS